MRVMRKQKTGLLLVGLAYMGFVSLGLEMVGPALLISALLLLMLYEALTTARPRAAYAMT